MTNPIVDLDYSKEVDLEPWEECPDVWAKPTNYFQWIRGKIREIWKDNPMRNEFIKYKCRPVTKEEKISKKFHPSTKNVGQCVFCEEWFARSKLEVDHKVPSDGCKNYEEAAKFLWYCARAPFNALQLACKPCHKIKTYAERYGFTFKQAKVKKQVIELCKSPGSKEFLKGVGIVPEGNEARRKEQIEKFLINK